MCLQVVKGLIHYERRLHQLMLQEEEKEWVRDRDAHLQLLQAQQAAAERLLAQQHGSSNGGMTNGSGMASPFSSYANGSSHSHQQLHGSPGGGSAAAAAPTGLAAPAVAAYQLPLVHVVSSVPDPASMPSASSSSAAAGSSSPAAASDSSLAHLTSPKYSRPEVTIQHYAHLNYWLVTIKCKDRNKLFFDTVCTLSDLNYDVYHGGWNKRRQGLGGGGG